MSIGQRLIPHVIDDVARSEPESVWAAYPSSVEALAQGDLTYINWRILSNSINRLAWWLVDHLGHGKSLETLCYVGPSDIRYFIFAVAACKAGYKVGLTICQSQLQTDRSSRHFSRHHVIRSTRMCL